MDTRSKKFSNNTALRALVFVVCAVCITVFCLSIVVAASEREVLWRINYNFREHGWDEFYVSEVMSDVWYSWMPLLLPCGIVGTLSLMYLMVTTGGRMYRGAAGGSSVLAKGEESAKKDASSGGAAGSSKLDNPRKSYALDRIWTEIQLVVLAGVVWVGAYILAVDWLWFFESHPIRKPFKDALLGYTKEVPEVSDVSIFRIISEAFGDVAIEVPTIIAVFALCTVVVLWFLLSIIRLVKSGRVLKNSLIGQIVMFVGGGIGAAVMNVVNGGSLMRKVVLILLGISILSATIVGAPIVIVLILIFAPKWVKRFEAIQQGVDEVKSGNLDYKIPIRSEASGSVSEKGAVAFDKQKNGSSAGGASGGAQAESGVRFGWKPKRKKDDELTRLARGINEISQSSSEAVKNELKNQRMKTELISNVSHDLKTPLTSLVTYIDLLKAEGLDSPNAPEYLAVLDAKTDRLRKLTEDLFEAAKASSGAMPVNMGRVDALALVNQVIGELDDRIQSSGLEFIVKAGRTQGASNAGFAAGNATGTDIGGFTASGAGAGSVQTAPPVKHMVSADGQLLYRVVDNLLNNVLKYALPGSRVYIDISEPAAGELVLIEFKNISASPLNIDPDELMERFKRGDESRATEGSGLGLAIAKDLVKLMGGWLELSIDGDLFKASVYLGKSPERTAPSETEAV